MIRRQTSPKHNNLRPINRENSKKLFIETYGCQMNVNDSEVVVSILQKADFTVTENIEEADLILINTCSIRDNAEQRIWGRLDVFRQIKQKRPDVKVGIIGCMAERLKETLLESKVVDIVAGPDAYRDLPALVSKALEGEKSINVLLSFEETYADISPVRLDKNGVTAFVSIMRGCNNVCSYCVVPYTRGAERSRNPESILREIKELSDNGYKEVTLLGQNVDSYLWTNTTFPNKSVDFARLLEKVALTDPTMRVRFATSHPKDMGNGVLYTMAMYDNICGYIHLPVQSGSSAVLDRMNRKYTREDYLERIAKIREILPNCSISTDIISGFCGETEEDHQATLSIMEEVGYDFAYMFKYSERPNTKAARHYQDNVPEEVKTKRLNEIIELQSKLSLLSHQKEIGNIVEVLVEGYSKRSNEELFGRTSQNKVVIFPKEDYNIGDYVEVKILECTSATLKGIAVSDK